MIFLNSLQASKIGPKMGDFLENRIFLKISGICLRVPWRHPNRSPWTPIVPNRCLGCLCLSIRADSLQKIYMSEVQNPPMDSPWVGQKLQNGREWVQNYKTWINWSGHLAGSFPFMSRLGEAQVGCPRLRFTSKQYAYGSVVILLSPRVDVRSHSGCLMATELYS